MKRIGLMLLILTALLLASCRCRQQGLPMLEEPAYLYATDSVGYVYVERVRIDTVEVEVAIPAQSAMVIVRDSVSYLETDFAESTARVHADGTLEHFLRNKDVTLKGVGYAAVKESEGKEREYIMRDIPVRTPYAVAVEKELTAWQKFRLGAFWWMAGALGLLSLWTLRTPIIKLVKKIV